MKHFVLFQSAQRLPDAALALRLHDMDHRKRRRVVIEYVRPTTDSYIVGAG